MRLAILRAIIVVVLTAMIACVARCDDEESPKDADTMVSTSSPYHLTLKSRTELAMLLNGSLLSSTSIVLVHATCSASSAVTQSNEVPASSSYDALLDVRMWMDDAYGCKGGHDEEFNTQQVESEDDDSSTPTPSFPEEVSCAVFAIVHVPMLVDEDMEVVMSTLNVSCSVVPSSSEWFFLLSPPSAPRTAPYEVAGENLGKKKPNEKKGKGGPPSAAKKMHLKKQQVKSVSQQKNTKILPASWWPSWNDTAPRRRASDTTGRDVWEMPVVLRDVLNTVRVALLDVRMWMDDAYDCKGGHEVVNTQQVESHDDDTSTPATFPEEASCAMFAIVHVPMLVDEDMEVVMSTLNVSCSVVPSSSEKGGAGQEWFFLFSPPSAPRTAPYEVAGENLDKKKPNEKKGKGGPPSAAKKMHLKKQQVKSVSQQKNTKILPASWWPSWNDTAPRRRASDTTGRDVWEMPVVLRDVLNTVRVVEGVALYDNTTMQRILAWKAHRGTRLGSFVVDTAMASESRAHATVSGVGRASSSKGSSVQSVVKVRARHVERLELFPMTPSRNSSTSSVTTGVNVSRSFVDAPQGALLIEARHVGLMLYCKGSLDVMVSWEDRRSELASSAKQCWERLHRSQRRHAVLHVLEHELTRRIPNRMAVVVPTHHNAQHAMTTTTNDMDNEEGVEKGVRVNLAADGAMVLSRVDTLESLRRQVARTASLLPVEWGSTIPLHVTDAAPLEPQRVLVFRWNASAIVVSGESAQPQQQQPLLRLDRWALKLQALLTSPKYYGRVRAFYSIVHPSISIPASSRTMDRLLFGERMNIDIDASSSLSSSLRPALVHVAALHSIGSQLPLSSRTLFPDGAAASGALRWTSLSALGDVSPSLLDAVLPPAHHAGCDVRSIGARDVAHPHDAFDASRRDSLSTFVSSPLRRLPSAAIWNTHVVGARKSIVAFALIPRRNLSNHAVGEERNGRGTRKADAYTESKRAMERIADHFLPIRSATKTVSVFRMTIPVLDDEGRVVAHPLTPTTSASSFEDHVGQVVMKTARVRRLPALMILLPAATATSPRQLVVFGESTGFDSRSGAKKKQTKPQKSEKTNDLTTSWTPKKLLTAIRNASVVATAGTRSGDAPRVGSRFVGSLSDAKLLAVAAEAHESTTKPVPGEEPGGSQQLSRSGIRFVNPEGWSHAEGEFSNMEERDMSVGTEGCVPGSVQCSADVAPWHIPAALRKVSKVDDVVGAAKNTKDAPEEVNTEQRSKASAASAPEKHSQTFSIDVFLKDILQEPRRTTSAHDDIDVSLRATTRQPFIGWNALRDVNLQRDSNNVDVFDL
ncbi:Hypothetical protein, putative [Bodo saltans]|uniref:Membrane-associated protein n=1 Tax=Bodo saltans TaxID=75058 RepID=A0A0S4IPC1_BODSA|nr:Hypothetical protein, putative [Bodo saltans]|eukprot:CUE97620.1 Hypothetical protein, putative [Bodo saltans]